MISDRRMAMEALHGAWERAVREAQTPRWKEATRNLFQVIAEIREGGWCVYWNHWNEPYMP